MDEAKADLHHAIQAQLDDGELALGWTLTIDVAGPDTRYLAHRSGGGVDGQDSPVVWIALGMMRASIGQVEQQLFDMTEDDLTDDE